MIVGPSLNTDDDARSHDASCADQVERWMLDDPGQLGLLVDEKGGSMTVQPAQNDDQQWGKRGNKGPSGGTSI